MEAIEVAVAWWVARLNSDKRDDLGDFQAELWLARAKAILSASSDNSKKQEMIRNIASEMRKRLEKDLAAGRTVELVLDYHPKEVMADIVEAAGIPHYQSDLDFPSKVNMTVSQGFVYVYDGYGADRQMLFSL